MNLKLKIVFIILGLIAVYAAGLGMRRAVLNSQYEMLGPDFPFTLESALQFRNVETLAGGDSLPEVDKKIQYPDGVVTMENDTIGAEYVYAFVSSLLPESIPLGDRVRWITAAWFCLGIPMLALWVGWRFRSHAAGFLAAAFYAVSLSAVIRSTGQELSRENFAIPLLLAHMAFDALAERGSIKRVRWLGSVLSALFLAAAMMTWDLIQFYVILWAVAGYICMVRGQWDEYPFRRRAWLLQASALTLAGLLNPYLKSHFFLLSPGMLIVYGTALGLLARRVLWHGEDAVPAWRTAVIGAIPAIGMLLWPGRYVDNYGHFIELITAKIRFMNVKPEDPSLLTFDQRILWVPGLDSSDWALTGVLFPYILILSLTAVGFAVVQIFINRRSAERLRLLQLTFFFVSSLVAYVLFVRFHVYLVIFAAGITGWFAAWAFARTPWIKWTVFSFLALGVYVEASHVLRTPEAWGRPGIYYRELMELTGWLEEYVSPAPVAANFGVSASIAVYGRCPVVLHPKFESRESRERVRTYGKSLFKGTERDFRDWADKYDAEYYVHALGEFFPGQADQQMRYMVDALEPPEYAAARLFENKPHDPVYFEWEFGNRKYRVFRIISRADEAQAERLALRSEELFQGGRLDGAEELAIQALALFPHEDRALDIMRHIGSLRDQGFEGRP